MPEDAFQAEIDVQIAADYANAVPAERLRAVALAVLRAEDRIGAGPSELNRDFLGKDAPTDVLAFAALEDSGPFVAAPEAGGYLGDVIVSYPRAVAQAREHGHSPEQELNLLVVHGILHLLGYDHADDEGKAVMWARQDAILAGLSV
jgi:probable rRNA maturation factor